MHDLEITMNTIKRHLNAEFHKNRRILAPSGHSVVKMARAGSEFPLSETSKHKLAGSCPKARRKRLHPTRAAQMSVTPCPVSGARTNLTRMIYNRATKEKLARFKKTEATEPKIQASRSRLMPITITNITHRTLCGALSLKNNKHGGGFHFSRASQLAFSFMYIFTVI